MNVRQVIPRDAIPSVEEPSFGRSYDGDADDRVITVDADPPRAYPLRFLHYHEIVNDVLGGATDGSPREDARNGEPIAVTWCPLCGSAVVYDRALDGQRLSFGVSGKLADDDLVMYDRETESEWKQSSGVCIDGIYEGDKLNARPAQHLSWSRYRNTYPNGLVMQPPGGKSEASGDDDRQRPIDYGANPYGEYLDSAGFGLDAHRGSGGRSWDIESVDPKTVVAGIVRDGTAVGVPLPVIESAGGALTVSMGAIDAVVFASANGLQAYKNPGYAFGQPTEGEVEADRTTWQTATGEAADGRSLEPAALRRLFAFAWVDDHGSESLYSPSA